MHTVSATLSLLGGVCVTVGAMLLWATAPRRVSQDKLLAGEGSDYDGGQPSGDFLVARPVSLSLKK